MKEDLSSVEITNPTSEDFSWKYNGDTYSIAAGETKAFAKPVSFHLAKHLSTNMIVHEVKSKMTKKDIADPRSPHHVKVSQLTIYDTHERRIALFKILKDAQKVVEVISSYPFKGFIGDMDVYQKFAESQTLKTA